MSFTISLCGISPIFTRNYRYINYNKLKNNSFLNGTHIDCKLGNATILLRVKEFFLPEIYEESIKMMKIKKMLMTLATGLVAVSAHAATDVKPTEFNSVMKSAVFSVTAKGWSDPAFGDAGWTHSGQWGTVTATKGQTVTITAIADDKGIHPGSSVWYRDPIKDTAPDNYVVDHFYPQNANLFKNKATDESTPPVALGNIIMKYTAHGYDKDKNIEADADPMLNGKKDGIAGKLTISFKAKYDGTYIFVVGAFNPDASYVPVLGADGKAVNPKVAVKVSVK